MVPGILPSLLGSLSMGRTYIEIIKRLTQESAQICNSEHFYILYKN